MTNVFLQHIHDVNLFVVTLAANAIEKLARGLRTSFAPYKSACVSPLLEKFKEKKPTVVEALANALDAVFASVSFTEIVDDIAAASNHKTPQVKAECMRWIVRCLKTTCKAPGKNEIKALGEILMKSIDDPAGDVRELAAEALGTMLRILGERPMVAFMDRLKADKIKETKVREFCEKAETKLGGAPAKPAATTSSDSAGPCRAPASTGREVRTIGSSRNIVLKPTSSSTSLGGAKKPAASSSAEKPGASSSSSGTAAAKPKAAAKAPVVEEAPISFKWSDEGAEEAAVEILEAETMKGLADANWKVRLESLNAASEKVKAKEPAELDTELFARVFIRKPGWKENNFQVSTVMINILAYLAKAPKFNKGTGSLLVPGLVDKLGDVKLKKVASDCLTSIAEGLSLQFVLSQRGCCVPCTIETGVSSS